MKPIEHIFTGVKSVATAHIYNLSFKIVLETGGGSGVDRLKLGNDFGSDVGGFDYIIDNNCRHPGNDIGDDSLSFNRSSTGFDNTNNNFVLIKLNDTTVFF